jgi:hypothetical protein
MARSADERRKALLAWERRVRLEQRSAAVKYDEPAVRQALAQSGGDRGEALAILVEKAMEAGISAALAKSFSVDAFKTVATEPTTENEDALLQRILVEPDDWWAKLDYATALARRKDLRARFIRDQVAMGGLGDHETVEVLRENPEWGAGVQDLVHSLRFHDGFIEEVTLDARRFLEIGPELYRRAPVRHLNLEHAGEVSEQLFASPLLSRIVSMDLSQSQLGDAGMRHLASSPYLGKLAWLDVWGNGITNAGIEALVASNQLRALSFVRFDGNQCDSAEDVYMPDVGGGYVDHVPTQFGRDLEARYGHREWLHYRNTVHRDGSFGSS